MASATVIAMPAPTILHGQSATFPVVVVNTGSSPALITSFGTSIPAIGFYSFTPQPLPLGGVLLQPGQSTTLTATGVFYTNQNPNLSPPVSATVQYNAQFSIGFSDGTVLQSNYITIAPLISEPGAALFYVPANSGTALAVGMI